MKKIAFIIDNKGFQETLTKVYDLMNKGEENLNEEDIIKLNEMTIAIEHYEREISLTSK